MILVLLDTNVYLRLAKRVRPLLGKDFGQKHYRLTILKDVENEVKQSRRLKFYFPWFSEDDFKNERDHHQFRLRPNEKEDLERATNLLRQWVLSHEENYKTPPSPVDCKILAFGQIKEAIAVSDDLSMHTLAAEFDLEIWHGHELLRKMQAAKFIDADLIREAYEALENNGDLPRTWKEVKHTTFKKVFGKAV